jgi:hypothetical protein
MTAGALVFIALMGAAWIALVWGWVAAIHLMGRYKRPGESQFNPLTGLRLWGRLFTPQGFGGAAEPDRRRILRILGVALGCFALAVIAFMAMGLDPTARPSSRLSPE